jgi:hypothetical protein
MNCQSYHFNLTENSFQTIDYVSTHLNCIELDR